MVQSNPPASVHAPKRRGMGGVIALGLVLGGIVGGLYLWRVRYARQEPVARGAEAPPAVAEASPAPVVPLP